MTTAQPSIPDELRPASTKLNDRSDWRALGLRLLRPIFAEIRSGRAARIHPRATVSVCRPGARRQEWELRLLWLAGPMLAMEKEDVDIELESGERFGAAAFIRETIARGADRRQSNCWPPPGPVMDQGIVEAAALAFGLVTARAVLWDKLGEETKGGINSWFDEVLATFKFSVNNWNLFPVLIHLAKWKFGLPHDWEVIDGLLAEVETMYLDDGWYADGYYRQFDYYVPWGIHFYLLIVAKWLEKVRPGFAAAVHERARRFSIDFEWYFDSYGRNIPYGRSLAYRFAASAFWSACAWSGVPGMDSRSCLEIASRNVEWFLSRAILANTGILSVGYAYPNEKVAELYISDGSPLWALKTFLVLAIPEEDSAWSATAAGAASPIVDGQKHIRSTNCILSRSDEGRAATLYNGGSFHPHNFGNHPAKYGKFAYSSHFGFNLADEVQPSMDSILSLSPDGQVWSHRHHFEILPANEGYLLTKHQPFGWDSDTLVTTALAPWRAWHVRLHWLRLAAGYTVRDGAFPVDVTHCENASESCFGWQDGIGIFSGEGSVAIFGELGASTFSISKRQIQVNVHERSVVVPYREAILAAGDYFWATAIFGSCQYIAPEIVSRNRPRIEWSDPGTAEVIWPDTSSTRISMSAPEPPVQICVGDGKAWDMNRTR
jgi:hypothetical protein